MLKIQVLWGVTGILGLLDSEDEASTFLRNVGLKCRDAALRLPVADSCLKCLVDNSISVVCSTGTDTDTAVGCVWLFVCFAS